MIFYHTTLCWLSLRYNTSLENVKKNFGTLSIKAARGGEMKFCTQFVPKNNVPEKGRWCSIIHSGKWDFGKIDSDAQPSSYSPVHFSGNCVPSWKSLLLPATPPPSRIPSQEYEWHWLSTLAAALSCPTANIAVCGRAPCNPGNSSSSTCLLFHLWNLFISPAAMPPPQPLSTCWISDGMWACSGRGGGRRKPNSIQIRGEIILTGKF